jgi:hypothetical protein
LGELFHHGIRQRKNKVFHRKIEKGSGAVFRMKNVKSAMLFLMMAWMAGCTQITVPSGGASQVNIGASQTKVESSMPPETPTAALTRTVTPPPTYTPYSGPTPDLELKDVAIYPTTFTESGQEYFLMGRVKNNTNEIMTFSPHDVIFSFTFDVWEYNSDIFAKQFEHVRYKEEIEKREGYSSRMNCILYPGEEGIFNYTTYSNKSVADYLVYETMKEYSGPLGVWYTYESNYYTVPELPLYYHPGTENLVFTKENGALIFDYDIVNIPDLLKMSNVSQVNSWVILMDKDGKILNILKKWMAQIPDFKYAYGGSFHVHSRTNISPDANEYFHPFMEITPEMIEQTDRLEVLNEFQEHDTCSKVR